MRWLLLLFPLSLCAQPTGLAVVGTPTPTEMAIRYTAPSGSACTLEVSEENDYTPVVNDVNATYFTDSNSDLDRADTAVNGLVRTVFFGKTGKYYRDANSVSRSRALHAETLHYIRVTCGSAATTTGTTGNIPLGQVVTTQAIGVEAPYLASFPSQNPFFQSSWVDASTGVLTREYPNMFGDAFAGSTGATGRTFGCAENITSGWVASDAGTLTNALAADDGVYAQTGTAGAKLFAGLCDTNVSGTHTKYPSDGTFSGNELSYQNVKLRIDCTGAGCGAGKTIKIALTTDRGTIIQTKTITATTTETEVILCHPENTGVNCPTQADPGDIWGPDVVLRDSYKIALGYVYNDSGDYTRLNFLVQADCDGLRVGDRLQWWDNGVGSSYSPWVSSLNCGASPPRVVLNGAARADGNSTGGLPFSYASGIGNNSRYGFLIWSDDNLTSSTIRIDRGLWRAASYIGGPSNGTCADGSGGFNKRFSKVKTSGGFTLCAAGAKLYAFKAQADGSLDMRFLGITYVSPAGAGQTAATGGTCGGNCDPVYFQNDGSDLFWSDTEIGVIYLRFPQNFTSPASGSQAFGIGKFILQYPETACGTGSTSCMAANPDGGDIDGRWPTPDWNSSTSKTLTACLNACSSASVDDYTVAGQVLRVDPGHVFARFATPGIDSVSGNFIMLKTREYGQDTFGQFFPFDIGDGDPIGAGYSPTGHSGTYASQQVFGFNPMYGSPFGRWSDDHTYQPPIYSSAFSTLETGDKTPYTTVITTSLASCTKQSNCGACPNVVLNGITYSSSSPSGGAVYNSCATLTLTSTWPGGSCIADGNWVAGDPVNSLGLGNPLYCYLQHIAAGDLMTRDVGGVFEALKVVTVTSPTSMVVERGCNSGVGLDGSPKNWGASTTWRMTANGYDPNCNNARTESGSGAQIWDFVNDPLAAATSFSSYQNHAFTTCNGATGSYRSASKYTIQKIDCADWASLLLQTPASTITMPKTFAGITSCGDGQCIEWHPSYTNSASATTANHAFFMDANPLAFFYEGASAQHTLITGSLYKLGVGGTGYTFNPKQFPVPAFTGQPPYLNVSGPGITLGTTSADRGKMCIAAVANECRSGSTAGDIYVNGPLDPIMLYCRGGESWSGQMDTCAGNMPNFGGATNQWRLPTANGQSLIINQARTLARDLLYRKGSTENVKANPDGDYLFFRSNPWYAKLPSFPAVDSVDRTTFIGQTISVTSVPTNTTRVLAKFGYDENFYPNGNRAEAGYAVASSVNASNPFLWAAELTSSSGVSCTPGTVPCTIVIPWLEGRMPRYSLVYRNSGGSVLQTDPLEVGDLGTGGGGSPGTATRISGARTSGAARR